MQIKLRLQGKFTHLPVNGEVIALLDIARCLYDAIEHMERAAEKGKAIVVANLPLKVLRSIGNNLSLLDRIIDFILRSYIFFV